jgi:tetratricopeptide (TPR) repeat protein
MRLSSLFSIISFIALITFFSSCTVYTDIRAKKPADIEGIVEIKRVGIINRTGIPGNSQAKNVLEGIITGESVFADRDGADKCVRGLYDCLLQSLNYDSIVLVNQVYVGNAINNFPPRFSAKLIDSLCGVLKVDAIVTLEFFDSNSGLASMLDGAINPLYNGGIRNQNMNNNNIHIKTGWRMYLKGGSLLDENIEHTRTDYNRYPYDWNRNGLYQNYSAVSRTGYMSGINHAFRISEQWVTQRRGYFKKGSQALRNAGRFARLGEWELAFELWEQNAKSMKRKVRARALHNLAVYYERKGDLTKAMEHANASFAIKHYQLTQQEIFALNQRIADEQRIISNKK